MFTINLRLCAFNLVEIVDIYHILLWFAVFTYNCHFLPQIFTFCLNFITNDQIYHILLIYLLREAFFTWKPPNLPYLTLFSLLTIIILVSIRVQKGGGGAGGGGAGGGGGGYVKRFPVRA